MYDISDRLQRYLVSGGTVYMIHTFEIAHSSLAAPLRFTSDSIDQTVTLDGETLTFESRNIDFNLGALSPGVLSVFDVTIDNVDREFNQIFFNISDSKDFACLTYRIFLSDDLVRVQADPIILNINSCDIDQFGVRIAASHIGLVNSRFPNQKFKAGQFPSIKAL